MGPQPNTARLRSSDALLVHFRSLCSPPIPKHNIFLSCTISTLSNTRYPSQKYNYQTPRRRKTTKGGKPVRYGIVFIGACAEDAVIYRQGATTRL